MKKSLFIDINADLGEGCGYDTEIMPLISSCSIACGGHYGDEVSMRKAIQLAKLYEVKIGAHPSFPNKKNFGRDRLTLTKHELTETIRNQIVNFLSACKSENVSMHHVKLHGALYNYAAIDAPTADAVVDGILATETRPNLYLPQHSILTKKAENLLPLIFEGFIDRRYKNERCLMPRSKSEAVINSAEDAWRQLYRIATKGEVVTLERGLRAIEAETFCIHGDHKHSVAILKYIRLQMKKHGIELGQK